MEAISEEAISEELVEARGIIKKVIELMHVIESQVDSMLTDIERRQRRREATAPGERVRTPSDDDNNDDDYDAGPRQHSPLRSCQLGPLTGRDAVEAELTYIGRRRLAAMSARDAQLRDLGRRRLARRLAPRPRSRSREPADFCS